MADVRALLQQQRAARRINHPHAVYSDSGKLSCAVCRELVRPESAWDEHLQGTLHRQNKRALHTETARIETSANPDFAPDVDHSALPSTEQTQRHDQTTQKRRHSETEVNGDVDMDSDAEDGGPARKKQHRPSVGSSGTLKQSIEIKSSVETVEKPLSGSRKGSEPRKLSLSTPQQLTPPLGRRSSGTPAQGVEMSIPSRPATPITHRDSFVGGSNSSTGGRNSAASTPKNVPLGRSPLIPHEASGPVPAPAIQPEAVASASGSLNSAVNGDSAALRAESTSALGISQADIDEDEWAAFEAEVVNAPSAEEVRGKPDMSGGLGLVASTAAVSAGDLATAGTGNDKDDERVKRRVAEEAQVEDEKAEATRALEEELEDMQELESRVQKLKEKREALRNRSTSQSGNSTSLAPPGSIDNVATHRPSVTMIDKENIRQQLAASYNTETRKSRQAAASSNADEEDDDEEDEEDTDWDVFRFK
ncbi:hypothetical protein SEPCBS57363_003473 [Sporothrix epigloea]|uniref:Coiled-coil domain-containing protein 16 n=1 Tax=Sporothrix epigloea TaxID=1892477 RepID=A0ABP0DNL9_9PEZI